MFDRIYESFRYKTRRIYYKYIRCLNTNDIDIMFDKLDKNLNYVALHNPNWLGITSSTKAIFKNTLAVEELYSKKTIDLLATKLIEMNFKVVVFSGMVDGWENLMIELKSRKKDIIIKIVWHGSNALISEKEELGEEFELPYNRIINDLPIIFNSKSYEANSVKLRRMLDKEGMKKFITREILKKGREFGTVVLFKLNKTNIEKLNVKGIVK